MGFSVTYYNENKKNEILAVTVTPASGYVAKRTNAGQISRHGIELQLDGRPIVNKHFMGCVDKLRQEYFRRSIN